MATDTNIADETQPAPAKEAAVNHEFTAQYDGHLPTDSYYYSASWGAYKGYVKGMLGGLFLGSGIGGAIGLVAAGVGLALSVPLFGLTAPVFILSSLAVGSAYGAIKGAEEFGRIMSVGGGAVALDEQDKRNDKVIEAKLRKSTRALASALGVEDKLSEKYPEFFEPVEPIVNPNAKPGDGPHMAAATAPTTKIFHWKTALIGLAIGAGVGALIATGAGLLLPGVAFGAIVEGAIAVHGLGHIAAFSATITGLFGVTFGIDRGIFRKVFDFTDHLFSGELFGGKRESLLVPQHGVANPVTIDKPVATRPHDMAVAPKMLEKENADLANFASTDLLKPTTKSFVERTGKSLSNVPNAQKVPDYWQQVRKGEMALKDLSSDNARMH